MIFLHVGAALMIAAIVFSGRTGKICAILMCICFLAAFAQYFRKRKADRDGQDRP